MWIPLLATAALLILPSQEKPAPPAATPPVAAATPSPAPASPRDEKLPASEAQAKAALEKSPRHGEYVDVKNPAGGTPIRTWVVYPERKDKAGVVIVIHEIFGLSDWVRGVADQLAREGFIAVAPDLISGMGPNGGGTDSVREPRRRGQARPRAHSRGGDRPPERRPRLRRPPSGRQRQERHVGFCWGGGRSFAYAATQPALDAAVVYYGTRPKPADIAKIKAPVLGFYGGDDARVTATVAPAEAEMKKLGKTYEPHVFEGAGHGFLRAQDDRDGANLKATREAWPRTLAFLRERLK